jgi:hypothetical protein
MFCSNCGCRIENSWVVCPRCAKPVQAVSREAPVGQTRQEVKRVSRGFGCGRLIVVILATIVAVLASMGFVGWMDRRSQDERNRLEAERMKDPAYAYAKGKEAAESEEFLSAERKRLAMYRLARERNAPDSLDRQIDTALAKIGAEHASKTPSDASTRQGKAINPSELSRDQVQKVRQQFIVEVVEADLSREYGGEFPYSDYLRVRITNNSKVRLPSLTLRVNRYDAAGKNVGWSRAPSIPTDSIGPGETIEYDWFPRGHLPSVESVRLEIEKMIGADSLEFFPELRDAEP